MAKKINTDSLTKLLNQAKESKPAEPSARQYIIDNFADILEARSKGTTYAAMAEALGISANSFSIALSKAKKQIAENAAEKKASKPAAAKPALHKPATLTQEY